MSPLKAPIISSFVGVVEEEEAPESKPPGVYRPPGARLTTNKRGPSQGPPEIYSDTQFPSLSASAKHVETRKWVEARAAP